MSAPMRAITLGVHVVDVLVRPVEDIPEGQGGQLVEQHPHHAGRPRRRHRAHAGQARGRGPQRRRDRRRRARRCARGPARPLRRRSPRCSSAAPDVQTSASVLPIRPDGSRPAFHVVGANATYTAADAPWDAIAAATHLHLGAPEFMGGEEAAKILSFAREHGVITSADILAPGEQAAAILRLDRARRSRTSTTCCPTTSRCSASPAPTICSPAAARCSSGAWAAWPPPAAPTAPWSSTPTASWAVPALEVDVVDTTGLRRRVLRRLPARPAASAATASQAAAPRLRLRRPGGDRPGLRPRRFRPGRRRVRLMPHTDPDQEHRHDMTDRHRVRPEPRSPAGGSWPGRS